MRMREEVDALRTMGFDPIEVLILPRIIALVIAVPILTFLGSMAALYGGGLVSWLYGGIQPEVFLARLREVVSGTTFVVGMIKAPFMALVIGIVACVEGCRCRAAPSRSASRPPIPWSSRSSWSLSSTAFSPCFSPRSGCDVAKDLNTAVIEVRDLVVDLKSHRILNGVTLDVFRGEILGFVGASGAGKSVLTRTILGLLPKQGGRIDVLGVNLDQAGELQRQEIERRWGILFQQGALFSSLTVGENVEFPIREYLNCRRPADDRNRHHQARNGRPEAGRIPQIPFGTIGRHDQARCARARAGARSGNPLS